MHIRAVFFSVRLFAFLSVTIPPAHFYTAVYMCVGYHISYQGYGDLNLTVVEWKEHGAEAWNQPTIGPATWWSGLQERFQFLFRGWTGQNGFRVDAVQITDVDTVTIPSDPEYVQPEIPARMK